MDGNGKVICTHCGQRAVPPSRRQCVKYGLCQQCHQRLRRNSVIPAAGRSGRPTNKDREHDLARQRELDALCGVQPEGGRGRFEGSLLDTVHQPPDPAEPTDAPPGSVMKILVMMRRVERGEAVHHPDDVRGEVEGEIGLPLRMLSSGAAPPSLSIPQGKHKLA